MSDNKEPIEIEYKYQADHIDWQKFIEFAKALNPDRELIVSGPDQYWRNEDNVIRYRYNAKLNELTVKTRKHKRMTTVRGEINQKLPAKTKPKHIEMFLTAIGYTKEFVITKDCHIFWFNNPNGSIASVVIYQVTYDNREATERYIEVEIEDAPSIKEAKDELKLWGQKFKDGLGLSDSKRINESLYEIYSGKKYKLQTT